MQVDVILVAYNAMGGHPVLSHVGDFLMLDAPASFGTAVTTVDIYPHFPNRGRAARTLESLARRYRERLESLPLVSFKRKQQLFEISYASHLGYAEEMLKPQAQPLSLALFRNGCTEIVSALQLIRGRLRPSDDFDLKAFDEHLCARLDRIPTTKHELKSLLDEIKSQEQQQIADRLRGK